MIFKLDKVPRIADNLEYNLSGIQLFRASNADCNKECDKLEGTPLWSHPPLRNLPQYVTQTLRLAKMIAHLCLHPQ